MNKDIEVIDKVIGYWKTVTKPSQVKVGQYIKLFGKSGNVYSEQRGTRLKLLSREDGGVSSCGSRHLFDSGTWKDIQAFFPTGKVKKVKVEDKRKSVKIRIVEDIEGCRFSFHTILGVRISGYWYLSRRGAISDARKFCKAIGFKMELLK
jgi:hypothetical protein